MKNYPYHAGDNTSQRVESLGAFCHGNRFFVPPSARESQGVPLVGRSIRWVSLHSRLEFFFGPDKIPIVDSVDKAQ